MNSNILPRPVRGRGARLNIDHRFTRTSLVEDPEQASAEEKPETRVTPVRARSIITRNNSPDVGFNLSVNPYQGCEHGCVYCFARPTHAYYDLSPGLDFETKILAKTNAVELLTEELSAASYRCEPIALGVNTDAYQPAERGLQITRALLKTCLEFSQPTVLITKSTLVLRDLDILRDLARRNLVRVSVSVTTLDDELKRRLEPRTAGPAARLKVIGELSAAGVPVSAMVAPVIPRINDHEMEHILEAVAEKGATSASYVLLRLPNEVAPLFREWLKAHYPDRADAVIRAIASCRGGKAYDAAFHRRMRGEGLLADMIARRFRVAQRRFDLDRDRALLNTEAFQNPSDRQMPLL